MLILLPPSEGKAEPARRGRPVDLDTLSLPELTEARRTVLTALIEASGRPDAAALLGVGPRQLEDVRRNVELVRMPARPALEIYTGVLYAALDYAGLSTGAKRRAAATIRVQSALWGPIGPTDRIPPYRLPICAALPGIGALEPFWRGQIERIAPQAHPGVIVDCRSSSFQTTWRRSPDEAARSVAVRVLTEVRGKRVVVSHLAKHTRGLVTRALLETERSPRTPAQVAEALAADFDCELVGDRTGWRLDVLTDVRTHPRPEPAPALPEPAPALPEPAPALPEPVEGPPALRQAQGAETGRARGAVTGPARGAETGRVRGVETGRVRGADAGRVRGAESGEP